MTKAAEQEVGPGSRKLTAGQKAIQPKGESGPKLDETVPGGCYMGEFGDWHDAHGNPCSAPKSHKATDDEGEDAPKVHAPQTVNHGPFDHAPFANAATHELNASMARNASGAKKSGAKKR